MKKPDNPYTYDTFYDAPDGKRYNWDPDFQQWYEVLTKEQYDAMSHWEKFGWLYSILAFSLLVGLCAYLSK